jgi:hypothetical protein
MPYFVLVYYLFFLEVRMGADIEQKNQVSAIIKGSETTDPVLPTSPEFRNVQISQESSIFFTGSSLEGVEFSFSEEALPAALFDNPEVWNYDGNGPDNFPGVIPMGTVTANALGKGAANVDSSTWEGINNSFGLLFTSDSSVSSVGPLVKDRPLAANKAELAENAFDAVINREPLFHETSGEGRGRAFKSQIENTLKVLQDPTLERNDPEVKKMIAAGARQLYSEAALEPNQVLPFYEMLKMGEFGRNITAEQFEKIINDLSPDQVKKLLDGSIITLKERLISPPKAWLMNKNGVIADEKMENLRGEKGATPKELLDVVNVVWTKGELLRAETNFYIQAGYHTDFYEASNHYKNFDAGIAAIEARHSGNTDSSSYINTLSPLTEFLAGLSQRNSIWIPNSYLTGTVEDVLFASGQLMQEEKEEKEKVRNESSGQSWFTSQVVTTLAALGHPDTVIDTKFKTYLSVNEIAADNPVKPVILSTNIKLPSADDTDDTKA